jgi:hypothetical protein
VQAAQLGLTGLALALTLLGGATFAQDGRFTIDRATVRPERVKPGQTSTFRTNVTAKEAMSGVNVNLEVKDKDNKLVAQRTFPDEIFSAGQTRTYEWKWDVPRDLAGGEYVAKVGVFEPSWGRLIAWNNDAARIRVEGGPATGAAARADSAKFDIADAKIDPSRVSPGQEVRIETRVSAKEAVPAVNVDVEVKDKDNNKIAQRIFRDERFDGGQNRLYRWTWRVPDDLPAGDYTVKVGVFDPSWQQLAAWDNDAGRIRVRGGQAQADESRREARIEQRLGLELEKPNPGLTRRYGLKEDVQGMIVTDVRPQSPAARAGVTPGDVIQDMKDAGREEVRLRVDRKGREREIVVRP